MKMTFKQFLSEAIIKGWDISGTDDYKTILDDLVKNCSSALAAAKRGTIIYRGFRDGLPFSGPNAANLIDFTKGERSSRDSENAYQLMMNASEGFKDYPSRSKSFICTTDINVAEEYGRDFGAYVMLPFNGEKIGVLSFGDMFAVRVENKFTRINLVSFDSTIKNVLIYGLNIANNLKGISDPSVIDSALSNHDPAEVIISIQKYFSRQLKYPLFDPDAISDPKAVDELNDMLSYAAEKPNLIKYLNTGKGLTVLGKELLGKLEKNKSRMFSELSSIFLTPETMNASLVKVGDTIPSHVECWFSGKAYVISAKVFYKLLDEVSGKVL